MYVATCGMCNSYYEGKVLSVMTFLSRTIITIHLHHCYPIKSLKTITTLPYDSYTCSQNFSLAVLKLLELRDPFHIVIKILWTQDYNWQFMFSLYPDV
jgi:hypothetical protein